MNCERHTFLSQYNNAAISSHVFAHSIHFQLFLFSVIHCTSSEERHLEGAASEERSHETTSEEPILSFPRTPHWNMFSYFQPFVFHEHFARRLQYATKSCFQNINRRRFNNFDIKFRLHNNGRNFTPSFQGKYLYVPAPRPRFYFFSFMANVLRIAFVHSLQLKRWWHFLFPSRAFWYFHVYLSIIHWEFNSFFPTRHQSLSSANEIILYFGSNITTWKFISSADTILSCEFASMQLTAQFVRLRSTFTNFLCNAALLFGTRIISMLRLKFYSLHKCFAGYRHGSILTYLSIINAIVHFGDVRLSTVYFYFQSDYNLHLRPVSNFNNFI